GATGKSMMKNIMAGESGGNSYVRNILKDKNIYSKSKIGEFIAKLYKVDSSISYKDAMGLVRNNPMTFFENVLPKEYFNLIIKNGTQESIMSGEFGAKLLAWTQSGEVYENLQEFEDYLWDLIFSGNPEYDFKESLEDVREKLNEILDNDLEQYIGG
ncbi:MAG: hypothetical protein ACRC68_04930, partial [Clostridium sp.]